VTNRFGFPSIIIDKTKDSEQLSDLLWSDPIGRKGDSAPKLGNTKNNNLSNIITIF
jgi:hypothetical protein